MAWLKTVATKDVIASFQGWSNAASPSDDWIRLA